MQSAAEAVAVAGDFTGAAIGGAYGGNQGLGYCVTAAGRAGHCAEPCGRLWPLLQVSSFLAASARRSYCKQCLGGVLHLKIQYSRRCFYIGLSCDTWSDCVVIK